MSPEGALRPCKANSSAGIVEKLVYIKGMNLRTAGFVLFFAMAGSADAEVRYKVWASGIPNGADPKHAQIIPMGVDAAGRVAISNNHRDNVTPYYVSSMRAGQAPQYRRNGFGHGMANNGDVCLQEFVDDGTFSGRYDATLLRADGTVAKSIQPTLEGHDAYATAVGEDGDTLAGFDYEEEFGYWYSKPWIHKNGVKTFIPEVGLGFITDLNSQGDFCGANGGFSGKNGIGSFLGGSFYTRNGQFHNLTYAPDSEDYMVLTAMNDHGQIAGYSEDSRPWIFDSATSTWKGFAMKAGLVAINNLGVAVGSGQESSAPGSRVGAVITDGSSLRFLEDLVPADIKRDYILLEGSGINDSGVIAVQGISRAPGAQPMQTFILTPVPEPGTLLAVGVGLATMIRRRRRSR